MMRLRSLIMICSFASVSGCAPGGFNPFYAPVVATEKVLLSDPQSCAIGYDLAKSIYEALPPGRTEIGVRKATGDCERHAIEYLRRAGFAISAIGGSPFTVETRALGANEVLAIGHIGDDLSISRIYQLAPVGVYGVTPPTIRRKDVTALQRASLGPRRSAPTASRNTSNGDL